jgi:diacylglycerol kinase family enzyme
MAGFLLVNPRAGDSRPTAEELVAEASARGIATHILGPRDVAEALARSAEADALGIAGGDGSLGAVAQAAIERGLPFVCIPFGTRNHFARDVGIDREDPVGALDAFVSRRERVIDVARAGERVFLNNVSFGAYARLVHRRERHRRRRDTFARARALAVAAAARNREPIIIDGNPVNARVLLVANNAYELDLFNVGERERLDEGKLYAYVAEGWLPRAWHERVAERFTIGGPDGRLPAAVDGEPALLDSPVELRIAPGELRILLPSKREP